jgi:hypothetical protein
MFPRVRFRGQAVINHGQDFAGHDPARRSPAAFFLVGGGMIDIEIRGIGNVTG